MGCSVPRGLYLPARLRPTRVVGLGRGAQVGKSTAAAALVDQYGFVRVSFASALKEMALDVNPLVAPGVTLRQAVSVLGWEVAKERFPEVRRFLQALGTDGVRNHLGDNVWVNIGLAAARQALEDGAYGVVFDDVRFPNESEAIRRAFPLSAIIEIKRDGAVPTAGTSHASETGNIHPDRVIFNNGTVEEMLNTMKEVLGL